MHNGKIVENFQKFINEYHGDSLVKYSFHLRIRGGKGGFGSLLRSFRVNKSTNKLMMRDLNGRRMASVDEEAKLKRYLEKQARKEQELKEKRKAKLEKLTAGPAKHKFEDQEYLSRREEIIEKTEDACEAGFALMKEKRRKSRMSENKDDEEESDLEDLFNERGGRKRKIDAPTIGEDDKKRVEDESDSENDSENEPDPEELEAIRKYFEEKKQEEKDRGEGTSTEKPVEEEEEPEEPAKRPRLDSASNVDDLPKIDEKTPCEYGPIELADFTSAEDLELLGLEHLKSGLTDRGLKCGGSLSERAARLWSIKGKGIREWPKNILTPEMKKKVAEEEEAERKAAKKAKKAKK
uniref:Replication stress response regulator SDE2 n=1 Tax=Caenorhabditis tropicalis TaxID=1561998 RepID=A0A1I7U2A7_9PELO